MKNFIFWQRWLFVVGIVITIFGILMAFLNGTVIFDSFNRQIDSVFWNVENPPEFAVLFRRWIYGVLGATIAGWGICLALIAQYPFRKKEKWAWNSLTLGLTLWYLVDTSLSLYFNVYFNAIFNTLLIIMVGLPLAFTRNSFYENSSGIN